MTRLNGLEEEPNRQPKQEQEQELEMTNERPRSGRTEEFSLNGEELLAKVRELVHEGDVRRIIIKNEEGSTLIEIPLTLGVVGALLLPVAAAVGAIAALAARCTIVVERTE